MEVGPKDLANQQVTIVIRFSGEKRAIPIKEVSRQIPLLLEEIHNNMYQK